MRSIIQSAALSDFLRRIETCKIVFATAALFEADFALGSMRYNLFHATSPANIAKVATERMTDIRDRLQSHQEVLDARADGRFSQRCLEWHLTKRDCPINLTDNDKLNPLSSTVEVSFSSEKKPNFRVQVKASRGFGDSTILWEGDIKGPVYIIPESLINNLAKFYLNLYGTE